MCRAKKAADIARATAEDLIMQAMEDAEDDIEAAEDAAEDDKAPEADAEDIIDVAAAAEPAVEDVSAFLFVTTVFCDMPLSGVKGSPCALL